MLVSGRSDHPGRRKPSPSWREGGSGERPRRKGINTSHRCPLPDGSISTRIATFRKQREKTQPGCSPTGWGEERRGEGGATLFYPTLFPAPASPRQLRLPCHLNEDFQKDAGAHKWTETPGVLGELRQSLAGKAESC